MAWRDSGGPWGDLGGGKELSRTCKNWRKSDNRKKLTSESDTPCPASRGGGYATGESHQPDPATDGRWIRGLSLWGSGGSWGLSWNPWGPHFLNLGDHFGIIFGLWGPFWGLWGSFWEPWGVLWGSWGRLFEGLVFGSPWSFPRRPVLGTKGGQMDQNWTPPNGAKMVKKSIKTSIKISMPFWIGVLVDFGPKLMPKWS